MSKTKKSKSPTKAAKERWASDVIVDLLHAYKLPHAAINPGASYREGEGGDAGAARYDHPKALRGRS
jgi:hypothetical protein